MVRKFKPPVVPEAVQIPARVLDPVRLAAVAATGLLDTEPEQALDDLALLAVELTGGLRAFVTLVDARRSFWKADVSAAQARQGRPGEPAEAGDGTSRVRENPITDSPCHILVDTGRELISEDAGADERIAHLTAVRELGIGAWAGFPVLSPDGQVLGGLCVVDDHPRAWTGGQVHGLGALARAVGNEIAMQRTLAQARLRIGALEDSGAASVELARTLQDSLLPPMISRPAWLEAAAVYVSAEGPQQVVGDFFDFFATRDDWWSAVMGDVCGHGLEAAKLTALARYTVRAEATQHTYPAKVLDRLNHALVSQQVSDRFLTAACVAVHPGARTAPGTAPGAGAELRPGGALDGLREEHPGVRGLISLGGHPPALLLRADGTVERLGRAGTLLGIMESVDLHTDGFDLHPGDALLLYTDGATETRLPDGTMLEVEGLAQLLSGCAGLDATDIADHLADILAHRYDTAANGSLPGGEPGGHAAGQGAAPGLPADDTAVLVLRVPA